MSLDLKETVKGEANDLDGAWTIILSYTCEQGSSAVHQLDLREVHSSFVSLKLLAIVNHFDALVDSGSINDAL